MSRTARRPLWSLPLACAWILVATFPAAAQIDILSGKALVPPAGELGIQGPESIVTVSAEVIAPAAGRPAMLSVTAEIAPPWYAYAISQKPVLATPTKITLDASEDYRLAGDFRPNLPPRSAVKDGHDFETHSGRVTWQAPLAIRPGADLQKLKVAGKARIQVCNDHSCLSPTAFPFTAAVVAATPADQAGAPVKGVYAHPNIHATIRGQVEPDTVAPGSTARLQLTAEMPKGWHVYERADSDSGSLGYKPTLIVLTNTSGFRIGPTVASEPAKVVANEVPGAPPQRYHGDRVTWTTTIEIPKDTKPGEYSIEGIIGYQTCLDVRCDLPRAARFAATIKVGPGGAAGAVPLSFADARYIEASKAAVTVASSAPASAPAEPVVQESEFSSLPMVILFSLVGGFILNFMPCVLPVIGLKILSFAEQAGRSRKQILILNIWYALGTLSVFMVLATLAAGVSLGLRDQNLGWGEQFSSTTFNVVMVAIVFVFALSFLGVWEIPIPGFVGSGAAAEVASHEGAVGAFVKGALTTVLATPCSGPALGPVFGYTLNQPPQVTFLIFGCIGLGMSSPYLLIGAFPKLIRFLPKPGAWMETFKQMMGFVMLGTIVFLFGIINKNYLVPTFAMMVGLWAACWWVGRTSLVETLARRVKAWVQGGLVAGVVTWAAFTWLVPHQSIIPWQNFSRTELAKLTSEGNTVLIDFTADWCLTCKANLFLAIETKEVRDAISANKVVPMLADMTEESPEIKSMLESLRSASIPVLAVFPADVSRPPIVLRDVITKQQVLAAIKDAGPSKQATRSLTAAVK
jgi:thiol:disulfide interchange protein